MADLSGELSQLKAEWLKLTVLDVTDDVQGVYQWPGHGVRYVKD